MQTLRSTTRRSFLARVAGGGLIAGTGLIFGAGGSAAQEQKAETGNSRRMAVDADPRDPARPLPDPPPSPRPPTLQSDPGRGQNPTTNASSPVERFVVCPGNPRCPST